MDGWINAGSVYRNGKAERERDLESVERRGERREASKLAGFRFHLSLTLIFSSRRSTFLFVFYVMCFMLLSMQHNL